MTSFAETRDLPPEILRAALDQAYDALLITTPELDLPGPRVEYVNDAFTRMTGYEAGEIIGKTPRILQGPRTDRRVLDELRRKLTAGEPFSGEAINYRKDGSEFWLEWRIAAVRDAGGRVAHWIAVQRDVTDRRALDEHRSGHESELERRVSERSAELAVACDENRRLFEREAEARAHAEAAQAALQAEGRRKDEFLAMLAHELRNPLASIAGGTQLLWTVPSTSPTLLRARGLIERQTNHLVRLIDDLLDISRLTRGNIELRKELIDVESLVADAMDASRALLQKHRHAVTLDLPSEALHVLGDPTRLVQVLGNLLVNAALYTPDGGRIWVEARGTDDGVELRVRDSGIGIAPDMLERVFDVGRQGARGPSNEQGGLGLGLALARRLVVAHGGTISAASAGPGSGSEFVVRLPRQSGAPVLEGAPPAPSPQPDMAALRVLVVDDNRDALEAMELLLAHLGHEVRAVEDGESALEIVEEFHPDLVLLDIGLPVLDGYQVARLLRLRGFTRTRLVALTGYGDERDRNLAREAGFDAHLVKPAREDQLARELSIAAHTRPQGPRHHPSGASLH